MNFPRRKTVLIVAVSLLSGILLSSAAFAYMQSVNQSKSGESVGLHDLVILKAYHPNGQLFFSAVGHNELDDAGLLLSECATGSTVTITGASCTSMISDLYISNGTSYGPGSETFVCGNQARGNMCSLIHTASSIMTQASSYPNPLPSIPCDVIGAYCTGWNSTAIFSGFTTRFTIQQAGAGSESISPTFGNTVLPFDHILLCTSLGSNIPVGCQQSQVTLNPGDSISVTIAFTVSGIA